MVCHSLAFSSHSLYVCCDISLSTPLGVSWCPDCVQSEHILEEVFASKLAGGTQELSALPAEFSDTQIPYLVVHLPRVPYKQQDFHLRKDPLFGIRSIPTLAFVANVLAFCPVAIRVCV